MAKNKISTKEKIIEKAISLYNQYGIEYVGVRELAKELEMKGGNITYYFPTKEDLVSEIARRLLGTNLLLINIHPKITVAGLLDIYKEIYTTQYTYRSLFLSLPLLLSQNKSFTEGYRENQEERRNAIRLHIQYLTDNGIVRKLEDDELNLVVDMFAFTLRFWISEAVVDSRLDDEQGVIEHYVRRIAGIIGLVATPAGKKDIKEYFTAK